MSDVVPSIEPLPACRDRVTVSSAAVAVSPGKTLDSARTYFDVSEGLGDWLSTHGCSIALTSYDTGQLFLVGAAGDRVSLSSLIVQKAMGLAFRDNMLWLGTNVGLQRFAMVRPPAHLKDGYDWVFIPRALFVTGDLDCHEIALAADGAPVFVNTLFSCICRLHETHSFAAVWKPPFVKAFFPGDACHLNGLALADGRLRYVTAFAEAGKPEGWRQHPVESGFVLDVSTGQRFGGLVKPHSPRLHLGALWVIDSGRGILMRISPATGDREAVAFLPGFARGLSFVSHFALITTSLPRDDHFQGLEIGETLKRKGLGAQCALLIVDLRDGTIAQSLTFSGRARELFDVCPLPGVGSPLLVAQSAPSFSKFTTAAVGPG